MPPMATLLEDQFAFRPTGSTKVAFITILHHVLDKVINTSNKYITIIHSDFAKAFDTIRHEMLAAQFSTMELPDVIYNWLINFLQDRSHATKYRGRACFNVQ